MNTKRLPLEIPISNDKHIVNNTLEDFNNFRRNYFDCHVKYTSEFPRIGDYERDVKIFKYTIADSR